MSPVTAGSPRESTRGIVLSVVSLALLTLFAVLIAFGERGRPALGTPTATVTPSPTWTSTCTATATATASPSATSSPTATLTPTFTLTPAPTATPTPTQTSAPTDTPLPAPSETLAAATATPAARITPQANAGERHDWFLRPIGDDDWQSGSIYYGYGTTGHGEYMLHHAIDLLNPMGTPVLAVADGEIVFAGADQAHAIGPQLDFYGNAIILRTDRAYNGLPIYCLYGHLSRVDVAAGQRVEAGQVIGAVGMSGVALGPHLHFEVRLGQNDYEHTVNPDLWLRPLPGLGAIVGRAVDSQGEYLDEHHIAVYQAAQPDKLWREVFTYIRREGIGPDPAWDENFVLADVWAGDYVLKTKIEGQWLTAEVTVRAGEVVFVEFRPQSP